MSTQTHSLLKKHYCPTHIMDSIAAHAAEHHIDLNSVKLTMHQPLGVTIGEPKCGHLIYLMAGIYGNVLRAILTDGEGNFIRELETYMTGANNETNQ